MEAIRLFILFFLLSSTILSVGAFGADHDMIDEDEEEDSTTLEDFLQYIPHLEESMSFEGLSHNGRFLAQRIVLAANSTCDIYPRVCRLVGSAGPDCCHKKCVNVRTDSSNCFKCGHKCQYGEICCKGKCKNVLNDKKNCGGCKIKCKGGEICCNGKCKNKSLLNDDMNNCGKCNIKCKYGEMCCKGKCRNVSKDEKNCGGCNIKCKGGDRCDYGICGYAS